MTHIKKYLDPRNPHNPRKNLTHASLAPTDPRNPRDLADSGRINEFTRRKKEEKIFQDKVPSHTIT